MPGGDRTGPLGMGPLTGRGAGYCRGAESPGFVSRRGGGFGRGGYGRGWRRRYFATGTAGRAWNRQEAAPTAVREDKAVHDASEERRSLEQHAEVLRRELEEVNQRLDELKSSKEA